MNTRSSTIWRQLGWRAEAAGYDALALLVRRLPVDLVSALGGAVVGALGPLTKRHAVILRNLELAFPEKTSAEREALAREHWRVIGRTFAEFPLVDRLTPASGRVEIEGLDRLTELARTGEAAVLISGHLSNWEIMMAVIVQSGLKCRVSYRPANNPFTDRRIIEARRRYGVRLEAAKGGEGTRALLSALNKGESVALLNDQRDSSGVEAPFFGWPVRTAPGPARLALRYGGRLIPMSVARTRGARFRVVIHPPIELERTGDRPRDLQAAVAKINAFIESCIRARPAEWLWSHRRWPLEHYADLDGGRRAQPLADALPSASSQRRQGPA